MRRAAWCALALVAACGADNKLGPAQLTAVREPTGLAVVAGRVLVLNSNADLAYDEATGGALLSLGTDPLAATSVLGGVRVHSMGGELGVARAEVQAPNVPDAEACGAAVGAPLAVFATRGSNTVSAVALDPATGALSCDGPAGRCGIPVGGSGFGDPLAVAVACRGGRARAYFGYLQAASNLAWVGELELTQGAADRFAVRTAPVGVGPVRGLAYDRDRDRLLVAGLATGTPTPLRWVNLAGCTLGLDPRQGGCTVGAAPLPIVAGSYAVELHGIALASPAVPGVPRGATEPIRAYLTGVLYDQGSAATSGYRTTGFGGVLIVADLYDDASGGVTPQIAAIYTLPAGAGPVRVLPRPAGWPASRRDVVAVVSIDSGWLTILDDETGTIDAFGVDATGPAATGGPILGHQGFGLAVDPAIAGSTARLWVGSFADSFVTPIDVTLDPVLAPTFAGGQQLKLTGATP